MTPFLIGLGSVRISSARASNPKWILVQAAYGYNALHAATDGGFVLTLPAAMNHSAQVVFSRTDSDILYFCSGPRLLSYDIRTESIDLIYDFAEYSTLASSHAEGDLQPDGSLALCGVRQDFDSVGTPVLVEEVFLFNVYSRFKGPVYTEPNNDFDAVKAAGSHLILSKESGIYDLTVGKQIATANGHACPAVYQGRDVLLWCNSAERDLPLDWPTNAVVMVDIETSHETPLKSFDWAYAMHISGEIVSVYDDPKSPVSKGLPFQIWRVPMDLSAPELLHEWTGPYHKDWQPRATVSADGKLICFNVYGPEPKVWALRRGGEVEVPAWPPKPIVDEYREIDYGPFEGRQYRFEQDFVARGGVLVATSSRMYEKI